MLQLQEKFKLIKPGSSVLDLGCAPGAWLQVILLFLGFFCDAFRRTVGELDYV